MNPPRFAFLDHARPLAFAHRGGALEAPENSWTSFTKARELGYHFMETDVHATKDGVVVTIHDPDLQRTADRTGLVREMTWKELGTARLIGNGGTDAVPRLDELLAAWPEVRWNIDAKHDSAVGPLIETIHRTNARDRVCVTSFSDRRLSRIRRALGPNMCTAMGPAATTALRVASWLPDRLAGSSEPVFGGFGAAQVPIRRGHIPVVDRRFVDAAHRMGLQVHVWTVDDEITMARLFDLGVDGIMTDRPTALKQLLVRRNQWV